MARDVDAYNVSLVEDMRQSLTSRSLEIAYEKSVFAWQNTISDEACRRLRVRASLLEDDNDSLQDQLADEDAHAIGLEAEINALRERLDANAADLQDAMINLRLKSRELENAKVEIRSLNGVSANSSKLLTEKLSLAHELAAVKPELEHLRSQASSHQADLAEKLSLQRQLATVQVELENEKRAGQRARTKETKGAEQDARYEEQLASLRADLAKEGRERERMGKEMSKASEDAEAKVAGLESKLDAFREKLRSTKDNLRETQARLQQAESDAADAAAEDQRRASKKRTSSLLEIDHAIGTPDGVAGIGKGPAAKRNKLSSAMPGEKSAFSITPFLNRTGSLAPESDSDDGEAGEMSQGAKGAPSPSVARSGARPAVADKTTASQRSKQQKKVVRQERSPAKIAKPLVNTSPGKANVKPAHVRKASIATSLEKVAEENEENAAEVQAPDDDQKRTAQEAARPSVGASSVKGEEQGPKKKRKKLLGFGASKTLFDEDDGGWAKPTGNTLKPVVAAGPSGPLFKSASVGKVNALAASAAGDSTKVFGGGFSPLKKDRKFTAVK
ncbi:MAG: hypothetical protein M1825_004518 [Sarcosagium campestre]|nr:MAG: hypothetical protein M1825_004518 [Sarcosagium campestre]